MPAAFDFPTGTDIWVPSGGDPQIAHGVDTPGIVARLVPAVSYQQARDAIGRMIRSRERYENAIVEIVSLRTMLVGEIRPTVLAIAAGALLLLFVACANAAHLLLARVGARRREFSVRRAVGASRLHLVQQVLCEGLVLSAVASVAAVLAAQWSVDALRGMIPETVHGADAIEVNLRTLVATGALGVAITIGFAGGPALSVWPRHALDALRTGALTTDSLGWRRFRHLLVAAEVAAACVLLSGAITVVRLVEDLTTVDIGIDHENAVTFRLMFPLVTYPTLESRRTALQRIEEEIGALPNVQSAGVTDQLPGAADQLLSGIPLLHETLPQPAEQSERYAVPLIASPDYFRAAGVQLLAGRFFTASDNRGTYPVSIVNERAARALGVRPDELVGARLIVPASGRPNTWSEIVGVVADVMFQGRKDKFQLPSTGLWRRLRDVRMTHGSWRGAPVPRRRSRRFVPRWRASTPPCRSITCARSRRFEPTRSPIAVLR